MNQRRISEATLRVRDALYEGLLLRAGLVIDEQVARERANNLSTAVLEVLRQLAEEAPPPVRFADATARAVPGQDVIANETSDEHARRVIR